MELRIVFDGPPGHEAGRFVECETPDGRSVNAGEWHERDDGFWELRLNQPVTRPTADLGDDGELVERLRELASFNRVHYPALCAQQEFYSLGDEAADRLILYREALSWLPAEISALRAAHEAMQQVGQNDEAYELDIQLKALESVQRQVDAVLSRSGH